MCMVLKNILARGAIFLFVIFALTPTLLAQELVPDKTTVVKAHVVDVISESTQSFGGTDTPVPVQQLRAEILEGENKGQIVEFKNDYVMLEDGDTFFLSHTIQADGKEFDLVFEPDRLPMLAFFVVLFAILVLVFGGASKA